MNIPVFATTELMGCFNCLNFDTDNCVKRPTPQWSEISWGGGHKERIPAKSIPYYKADSEFCRKWNNSGNKYYNLGNWITK